MKNSWLAVFFFQHLEWGFLVSVGSDEKSAVNLIKDPSCVMHCFSCCFLILACFHQLGCDVSVMWLFLRWLYLEFVQFLGCVDCFSSKFESFQPLFLSVIFLPLSLPALLLGLPLYVCSGSVCFSLFLFLSTLQIGWSQLTLGLLILSSTYSDVLWIFHFSYCNFQLQKFCLALLYSFPFLAAYTLFLCMSHNFLVEIGPFK